MEMNLIRKIAILVGFLTHVNKDQSVRCTIGNPVQGPIVESGALDYHEHFPLQCLVLHDCVLTVHVDIPYPTPEPSSQND
ncbi:hypothetical protein Trydic_g22238 [Trypoxylus dichotomus]